VRLSAEQAELLGFYDKVIRRKNYLKWESVRPNGLVDSKIELFRCQPIIRSVGLRSGVVYATVDAL
jgi:hypothetical protein